MKIITLTCEACGTVVAANELETNQVTKCPRLTCDEIHSFQDLPPDDREHFLENRDQYQI